MDRNEKAAGHAKEKGTQQGKASFFPTLWERFPLPQPLAALCWETLLCNYSVFLSSEMAPFQSASLNSALKEEH